MGTYEILESRTPYSQVPSLGCAMSFSCYTSELTMDLVAIDGSFPGVLEKAGQ